VIGRVVRRPRPAADRVPAHQALLSSPDAVVFTGLPVIADEWDVALGIINTVFGRLEEQFDHAVGMAGSA